MPFIGAELQIVIALHYSSSTCNQSAAVYLVLAVVLDDMINVAIVKRPREWYKNYPLDPCPTFPKTSRSLPNRVSLVRPCVLKLMLIPTSSTGMPSWYPPLPPEEMEMLSKALTR